MLPNRANLGRRAGLLMLLAIALGMAAANSPLAGTYAFIHDFPLRLGVAPLVIDAPLIDWVNQGLLVVFFFHIGLHTKHEMTVGLLAGRGRAAVPAFAALGGMLVPALLYLAFNAGNPAAVGGWAIPIATDVVLVLGLLSFLGTAVSPGLRAFVMAVAIFDDLGAVIVIALNYGHVEAGWAIAAIIAGLAGLGVLNRRASGFTALYALAGVLLWAGLVESGLEGAVAGAIVGFALPLSVFKGTASERAVRRITPFTLFVVVPCFAFFNAGVALDGLQSGWLADPVASGIIVALLVGKPLGVVLGTYGAIRAGVGKLPAGTSLRDAGGAALLAGIGFTMSLFIVTAAFDDSARADVAKLAVLVGSSLSAALGALVLVISRRRRASPST